MIIVKLIGGLGNQMFEVAFARMLALELDEDIYLDISSYKRYKIRSFSLSNLYINNSVRYMEGAELPIIYKLFLKVSQKKYHVYQKVVKVITRSDRIGRMSYETLAKIGLYYNFDVYYYDVVKSSNKVKCLYGYFQSEKYFKKYKKQIIKELKVKTPPTDRETELLKEIKSCNAVGVSIRLGDDYTKSSLFNVCNDEYYYRGMDYIFSNNEDAVFFIFSDCIDKVKERFKFKYSVRFIEGFKDYEGLRLMYSCRHFIISNSSFSWWGAYLASNSDKIVIAPSKWYNNSKEQPDIYLDEMTLLNV